MTNEQPLQSKKIHLQVASGSKVRALLYNNISYCGTATHPFHTRRADEEQNLFILNCSLGGPRTPPLGPSLCTRFRNQKIRKSENQKMEPQK